ncbi:MAG: hypothetical protein JXC85_01290 [Candidatus Aenigmarchaeota archaeon]|nr:hypothetical protein [Candidatus Aenigmarchaeota archaeon]
MKMKTRKRIRDGPLWPVLIAAIFFSLGGGFVIAYESGLGPDILGHDVGEIDWSGTIPSIRIDQTCLGGDCRYFWPSFQDTRCDQPTRCSQICIGTSCKSSWPAAVSLPPNCDDYSLPKWTGSAWSCVPVDIGAPLYYDCPSMYSACSGLPCEGQQSAYSYCYRSVNGGWGFCTGCGCYYSQMVACTPRYS